MKKVHIIPHSHWDREWYMAYERHHMLLIELIDNLIELFRTDPDYKSFHLDGQTIILEDYLEVRPENRSIVKQLVKEGKLKIGPFYILQDDFLTTSESNARNMLLGAITSREWTDDYVKLGYFPDTFGNMGQTPQLMKEAGLEAAAFGRGVKPTGFGNQIFDSEKYSSNFSELFWKGPDGTDILGILFANWYCNGKEIPTDPESARQYWDKGLASAAKYASASQLLFLNGCDHQPVQKDLSEAIRVANQLYPEIEFVHSDFDTYIRELKAELPENLNTVKGELTSQETDGWTTLANTASARVYLKQENTKASKMLEEIAEPLAVFASRAGKAYPQDQLDYAWKLLMQNQPHDSICGCSVDAVHAEMMTRYHKTEEVAQYTIDESLDCLKKNICTSTLADGADSIPFVIFNTSSSPKEGLTEVVLAFDREQIDQSNDGPSATYKKMAEKPIPAFSVHDGSGREIPIFNVYTKVAFDYDLPKDAFRKPYMARFVRFTMNVAGMKSYSWETFRLDFAESERKPAGKRIALTPDKLENDYLQVKISTSGTLDVLNKQTGECYRDLLIFEDMGDVGNEYVYRAPSGDVPVTTKDSTASICLLENNEEYAKVMLIHHMELPVSMNEQLELEQKSHVDYRKRNAKRSKKTKELELSTILTLTKNSPTIDFTTEFDNQMKDHRLRVLFNTGKQTAVHYADSIFEVVKRDNKVSGSWENPENPQHTHAFVNVHDKKGGLTVGAFGLNEYEVAQDGSCIKTTLLRSVGEMGDWGYFPAPEAQCIGRQSVQFSLTFHAWSHFYQSLHQAFSRQVPFITAVTDYHEGALKPKDSFLTLPNPALKATALKKRNQGEETVLRCYNLSEVEQSLKVDNPDFKLHDSNLLEEDLGELTSSSLAGYKIKTLLLKD